MHTTELNAVWGGGFAGEGFIKNPGFESVISLPREFGGIGLGASPEDLLLNAVGSCYLITLGIVLEKRSIKHTLALKAHMDTELGPPPKVKRIILRPTVRVNQPDQLKIDVFERAKMMCLVSQALA